MIPDGATIMYGGFLGCGSAHHIIEALAQKGTKDLTIIGNDCGMATGPNGEEFYGVAKLVHNHQVKHVIATHVGMTPDVGTQGMVDKTLTVDLIPQGTLAEMIRAGGAGLGGGHDEREQTLNQLLAEMDGFDPTKGVILLAATNRPEVLDQALLRPGRFDRRITIDRPNLAGRIATLQVHTRNIKLAEDVNLKKVALATAGCVGADLANLVNEAALRAVRKGRKLVTQEDLLAAFELVIAGAEKKGSVLSEFEKKLVAYHEVGHAMVAYRQKHAEPVSKITIVPHTQGALGYTLHLPEEDKHLHTRDELLAQITVSMGGRVAEELVLHTMTNGAAQDIQDATGIARNMVAMFGMSDEFGMMALASRRNQYLDGGYGMDCAQDTAARMDQAVKDILDQCYQQAVEVIKASREDMDKVVAYLLEKETITGAEMVAILEGRDPALADNFPDPDGKGTVGPPAEPVSDPIPLSGGEPQPPNGGGMEFGPEGKPKE